MKSNLMNPHNIEHSARLSNIEASRIFAMSLIVIWHFCVHTISPEMIDKDNLLFRGAFVPLIIYGVDLFVLISGYFLIRLRPKVLISIGLVVWSFEVISILGLVAIGENLKISDYFRCLIDPLGSSHYWFITFYIASLVSLKKC